MNHSDSSHGIHDAHGGYGVPVEGFGAEGSVRVDCDTCEVRGVACGDCVVTFLLGAPPEGVALDADERRALEVLAGSGLVPPLRMVTKGGQVVTDRLQVGGQSEGQHSVG